jgi:predicted secreted protein
MTSYARRMPGVAFVAHCMLNQNSKTAGGASCPGIYSPLVDELRAAGWRIEQMPCPELAFTGLNRFWAVREQLDTAAYRRHCQRLAAAVAGAIMVHLERGDDVILVGLEGSPSLGVHITSSDPARGGRPEWAEGAPELTPGSGIFIDELTAELAERGVPAPRGMGVSPNIPGHDPAVDRAKLHALMDGA